MHHLNRRVRMLRALLAAFVAFGSVGVLPATALAAGSSSGAISSNQSSGSSSSASGGDLVTVTQNAGNKAKTILGVLGIVLSGGAVLYGLFLAQSAKIVGMALLGCVIGAFAVSGGLWNSGSQTANGLLSGGSAQTGTP